MIEIRSDALTATINPLGAELWSLRDAQGGELMTDADPAYWTGHAPLLFPIIGELKDGHYRLDGQSYALPRHGFARRMTFETLVADTGHALFRLVDTAETHEVYPFAFELLADFRLTAATLVMTVRAINHSAQDMPASFGFHPAFAWPLPYGAPREAHRILFDQEEPEPLKQLVDNLIVTEDRPTPVDRQTLMLRDQIFEHDALIWENLASDKLIYGPEGGPGLNIAWAAMPNLGIWTKPGASYVCIEPWAGIADSANASGEIWDKPGIVRLGPGTSGTWGMSVTLTGA